jgi:two-component system sensor histidine kinase FlrB
MSDIELLSRAMETFNNASSTMIQYYSALEEKVLRLTEEVDHKQRLLAGILDSIDVGVVFFDGDGIIRLINSAGERMLSVEAGDIIGSTSIRAVIRDEVIEPENGKPFNALVSGSDVKDGKGDMLGRVLIFKDITRLKHLEAENERNRRLTAMGELVMKITHEIRNPLGSIELFASLLSDDLKGTEHGEYADRISNSVRSLVNALDNMLGFSRGIRPHPEYCLLNDVISGIAEEFRELFVRDNVVLSFSAGGTYRLRLDKGLIRQALINILLNSVQAMPEGGEISVTLRPETEAATPVAGARDDGIGPGDFVEIVIRDSGTGMDEETRTRLFEPFYSTKDRGTGLGMSITAGIVQAHKGSIRVESAKGKGTEFVIKLPMGD